MKNKWKNVLLYSLGALLLINIICAFFLYQIEWKPVQVSFTIEANYNTSVWTRKQPKFKDTATKSEIVTLKKDTPIKFSISIDEAEGLKFFGFFWSQSEAGNISISDIHLESKDKHWEISKVQEMISYPSTNISTTIKNNTLVASTNTHEKANGWLMFDTQLLEEFAKKQKFAPLGLIFNALLFVLLLALNWVFESKIKKSWNTYKFSGKPIVITRRYVLSFWVFLLPFWPHISHVLLALSLALLIAESLVKRDTSILEPLKLFIPLGLLFLSIVFMDIFFHQRDLGNDVGDYIYFLLATFVFLGIDKQELKKIFKAFTLGVIIYVVLLFIAVFERYISLEISYSFTQFAFESTELYWHTSYLASLMLLAFFFELLYHKLTIKHFIFGVLVFVILALLQARLPMVIGIIIIAFILLRYVSKKRKFIYSTIVGCVLLGISISIGVSKELRNTLTENFLVSDTDKIDARPALWQASLTISKDHLIEGIGRSQVRGALAKRLDATSDIQNRGYNTHNQYLEFLLSYGAFVFIIFLLVLALPVIKKYRTAVLFVTYFGLAMLVESYFSRQAGVVIFSLFYSFFVIYDHKS
ncbi:MAG TPA: hypothetical protein DCS66_09135 [Flavobacteriaceae bacterium]|nr:hypothetical protein [Flavobacteriaceae bacterium]HAT64751.1 hypothetical protein [Flavobacteriaceae bacterium]|tara:strand:- start:155183 stop:156940 length:1758 start_codon:yes stop_codon:yes gene_type:complete